MVNICSVSPGLYRSLCLTASALTTCAFSGFHPLLLLRHFQFMSAHFQTNKQTKTVQDDKTKLTFTIHSSLQASDVSATRASCVSCTSIARCIDWLINSIMFQSFLRIDLAMDLHLISYRTALQLYDRFCILCGL